MNANSETVQHTVPEKAQWRMAIFCLCRSVTVMFIFICQIVYNGGFAVCLESHGACVQI